MYSTKLVVLCVVAVVVCRAEAGVAPLAVAAPYAVAPFASSYTAHTVNHNIATPYAAAYAAPYAAAFAAPYAAAYTAPAAYAAPYGYAPAAYSYAPAAYHAAPAAYVAAFK